MALEILASGILASGILASGILDSDGVSIYKQPFNNTAFTMPSPPQKRITRWLWISALGLSLVWTGGYAHHTSAQAKSAQAQKQCQQWIPHLEAYRKAKGRYPMNFSKLAAHNPAAKALRYREYGCGYGTTRGEWFELHTPVIGGKVAIYHSDIGEWQPVSD